MIGPDGEVVRDTLVDQEFNKLFESRKSRIKHRIEGLTESDFESESVESLTDELYDIAKVERPTVDVEDVRKEKVGDSPNAKIRVAMPFEGSIDTLSYQPKTLQRTGQFKSFNCEVTNGLIAFEVPVGEKSSTRLENEINRRKEFLSNNIQNLAEDIEKMNRDIESYISNRIGNKKEEIMSQSDVVDDVLSDG